MQHVWNFESELRSILKLNECEHYFLKTNLGWIDLIYTSELDQSIYINSNLNVNSKCELRSRRENEYEIDLNELEHVLEAKPASTDLRSIQKLNQSYNVNVPYMLYVYGTYGTCFIYMYTQAANEPESLILIHLF